VAPVRITDFGIAEEAFDPILHPIRAKINLGMRLLSVDDLGFDGEGGSVYVCYQQQEETWAADGLSRLADSTHAFGVTPVYENHAKPGA
jgi:hypothetical protein